MARTLQFVSFFLDGQLYGLDIRLIKEVNPNTEITPVPRTPRSVRGLVNVRGQVVLVIDIAAVFGRPSRPITPDSQVVILKTAHELAGLREPGDELDAERLGERPVGFLIDGVGDVVTIPIDEVKPPPLHLDDGRSRYYAGVVRVDERLLVILNAGELLA